MSSIEIKSYDEFKEKVLGASVPVLVDFFADWCGPCRMLAPMIEQMAQEASGYEVYKVNVDSLPDIAAEYGVSSIPTLVVISGGNEVNRQIGLADKKTIMSLLGL